MTSNPTVAPTDEDFLVAVEEALEGVLLPYDGVGALEAARNAVVAAVGPLVAQLRQAVFPEPPSRAAVLREAAEKLHAQGQRLTGEFNDSDILHEDGPAATVATWKRAADLLRRSAAEPQQPCPTACDPDCDAACHEVHQPPRKRDHQPNDHAVEAQQQPETEAHPAEHSWAAELYDPTADEWVPGTRYLVRDRAVNALAHANKIGPAWKDGTPTQRRLVRATTTYTVEQPAAADTGEEPQS